MRERFKRVESNPVQGELSYIALRRPTRGEVQGVRRVATGLLRSAQQLDARAKAVEGEPELLEAVQADFEALTERNREITDGLIIRHLVEWNWVDEEKNPLPLPQAADDLDALTSDEAAFLERQVMAFYAANAEQEKN